MLNSNLCMYKMSCFNKNEEELYRIYTYYILLEYFDNIVYLSNNNDTEATTEDIEELEKLIKVISKK